MLLIGTADGLCELATQERRGRGRRHLWRQPIAALAAWRGMVAAMTADGAIWRRGWWGWRRRYRQPVTSDRPTALAIGPDQTLWEGTAPARLWMHRNSTWQLCQSLRELPSAGEWWGLEDATIPRMTAIAPDPRDPQSLAIAIAVGGVFSSTDGGHTWMTHNDGIAPIYPPEAHASEAHRDVVALHRHPGFPNVLYATTESGYYRAEIADTAWHWRDCTPHALPCQAGPLSDCLPLPPERDSALAILPLPGQSGLVTLWRTADAGSTWQPIADAPHLNWNADDVVPSVGRFRIVVAEDVAGIAIITPYGDIWVRDAQGTWTQLASDVGMVTSALWAP